MRIPFLHHTGTGLWIGVDRIVLVDLVRFRDTVRVVSALRETIEDGDTHGALTRLRHRLGKTTPFVVSLVDTGYVRHTVLDVPAFDDPKEQSEWLDRQTEALIPVGVPDDLFLTQRMLHPVDDDHWRSVIGVVRRSVVEERLDLLEQIGFSVLGICSVPSAFGSAFVMNPEFVEGKACFALSSMYDSFLVSYENGGLTGIEAAPVANELPEMSAVQIDPDSGERMPGIPTGLSDPNELLEQDTTPALGLAMGQVYSGLPRIDFLDDETRRSTEIELEKQVTKHLVADLGAYMAAACIVLFTLNLVLARAENHVQTRILDRSTEWHQFQERSQEVDRLRELVRRTSMVIASGTRMTPYLDAIGFCVPEGLWLTNLDIALRSKTSAGYEVTITGTTSEDVLISDFLAVLDDHPLIERAELSFTSRRPSYEAVRDSQSGKKSTTRFEIFAVTALDKAP